jgi:hypothetical protein
MSRKYILRHSRQVYSRHLTSTLGRCCIREFPRSLIDIVFNHWIACNSLSPKHAKPPSETPSLFVQPSVNLSKVTHSLSSVASGRCERLKLTLRYIYISFDTTLCSLTSNYFICKILKETQLRQDNLHSFASHARAVSLRRRHSPSSNA